MTRRLVASYLLITVVALLLLEVPLGLFFAQRERERTAAGLEHDATVLATIYEDALENDRPVDDAAAVRYTARTDARVVVVDADGVSVVDTRTTADRDFSTRPEIVTALSGRVASGTRSSDTLATDIMYVAIPVASGGTVHGAVRVTLDTSDVTARIHRFWLGLAAIAVVILTIVALVGWFLARSVSRPITRLQADADRYASGDLSVRATPSGGPPEVRALAASFTTMAAHLDELLATHRAFVADASHQLRSPLTALTLRLENLQSRLPPDAQDELDATMEESKRLTAMVNDLLQLARADERRPTVAVDLARLSRERVDTWTAVADTRQVTLCTAGLDGVAIVDAAPGAIEQILDNLLDNALTASPPGTTITTSIVATPGHLELLVSDEGPGLDDEAKSHALRRFWRGSTASEGTGLGLAIVDALTTASNARLALSDAPGGGLTVAVRFPAADHDRAGL